MTILPGKPKHLFATKDGRAAFGKTIAVEQFTPEQRAVVERAVAAVGRPSGVLVGAHFMESLWDVRPLVLERGVMTITRFSDPGLSEPRREGLARCHGSLSGIAGVVACGRAAGLGGAQIWMRRIFAGSTLAQSPSTETGSTAHPLHRAGRLVSYVRYLDSFGVIHGHIAPDNVAFDGENPLLLDYGFAAWSSQPERYADLAPEVSRGAEPSTASDVYGLATVLKTLLGGHLSVEHSAFLDRMLAAEPGERPAIGAVEAFFSGGARVQPGAAPVSAVPGGARLGSGRVVTPTRPTAVAGSVAPASSPRLGGASTESPVLPPTGSASPVSPTPPQSSLPRVHAGSSSKLSGWWGVIGLVVAGAALVHFGVVPLRDEPEPARIPHAVFWASGQPEMMRRVAEAALVEGDPTAERVIVADALNGNTDSSRMIRASILRLGYNPLWQHELGDADREVLLGFGLAGLLNRQPPGLPDLKSLHPGVLVAIAADLDVTVELPALREVPLVDLAQLPAPFGPAFLELLRGGGTTLAEPAARAASHLLVGDASPAVIRAFFPEDGAPELMPGRVRVIVPLLSRFPTMERALVEGTPPATPLAELYRWFDGPAIADWRTVRGRDRFAIIAGLPPSGAITQEHSAELLRFPLESVRRAAAERLAGAVKRPTALVVPVLADSDTTFSREQVVALIAALEVAGPSGTTFVQGWFGTEPDAQGVLRLLIARASITEIDAFNVEAARYLKDRPWEFSLDEIEALTQHAEPLARALAYARLDARDTAQRTILAKAVEREASPTLRELIKAKLDLGA